MKHLVLEGTQTLNDLFAFPDLVVVVEFGQRSVDIVNRLGLQPRVSDGRVWTEYLGQQPKRIIEHAR